MMLRLGQHEKAEGSAMGTASQRRLTGAWVLRTLLQPHTRHQCTDTTQHNVYMSNEGLILC
jgi:hypothetical protein